MPHRPRVREKNFGMFIRARRLCYCWIESRGYYMRCREIEGGFLIELAPPVTSELKDSTKGKKQLYRMIDTPEQAKRIISASPVLSAIKAVKKHFQITLDEYGNQI